MDPFEATSKYASFKLPSCSNQTFKLPNTILGKQAELLFEQCIRESEAYNILAANLQIQGETETLGELDFLLLQKQTGIQMHVEVACKFYLYDESNHETLEGKWIGPNRKDTLLDKITKLTEKQFPILHHSQTKKKLLSKGFLSEDAVQKCFLLSSLFVPFGFDTTIIPVNYRACIVGYWIYYTNLSLEDDYRYAMPSKKEWLLPPNRITSWFNAKDICPKISEAIERKRTPLIYKKKGSSIDKFFVVWWEFKT